MYFIILGGESVPTNTFGQLDGVALICNLRCESAVSQFNLPTDIAVRDLTMHTYIYIYTAAMLNMIFKNDIKSLTIITAAPWSHRSPLESNLEPGNVNLLNRE